MSEHMHDLPEGASVHWEQLEYVDDSTTSLVKDMPTYKSSLRVLELSNIRVDEEEIFQFITSLLDTVAHRKVLQDHKSLPAIPSARFPELVMQKNGNGMPLKLFKLRNVPSNVPDIKDKLRMVIGFDEKRQNIVLLDVYEKKNGSSDIHPQTVSKAVQEYIKLMDELSIQAGVRSTSPDLQDLKKHRAEYVARIYNLIEKQKDPVLFELVSFLEKKPNEHSIAFLSKVLEDKATLKLLLETYPKRIQELTEQLEKETKNFSEQISYMERKEKDLIYRHNKVIEKMKDYKKRAQATVVSHGDVAVERGEEEVLVPSSPQEDLSSPILEEMLQEKNMYIHHLESEREELERKISEIQRIMSS